MRLLAAVAFYALGAQVCACADSGGQSPAADAPSDGSGASTGAAATQGNPESNDDGTTSTGSTSTGSSSTGSTTSSPSATTDETAPVTSSSNNGTSSPPNQTDGAAPTDDPADDLDSHDDSSDDASSDADDGSVDDSIAVTDDTAAADDETLADDGPTPPETEPDDTQDPPVAEPTAVDVADVWSGHPVTFALVTRAPWQFAAYYDGNQRLVVASRQLDQDTWSTKTLPTSVGWDSHNYIAMAADQDGYLHVSGNMHNVPLIYYRSTEPFDIDSLEQVTSMVGSNESSCTYPEFFTGPDGNLVFAYRDGGSGNGNHIFNRYDIQTRAWTRVLDTPLTDGQGERNAYPVGPIQGPDDLWHLVWVWRDTPDASTNHDISYARTENLVQWQAGSGQALQLPITLSAGDIVDPVPSGGGMINNNTKVGFDAQQRPIVSYHKYDQAGNTQLYNARFEDETWVVHRTSNWDTRWDFGGNGTLIFEIELEGPQVQDDGRLTQTWYNAQQGGWGAFVLDPDTLEAIETIDPPLPYPPELDQPESETPGMLVRWANDWARSEDAETRYLLRWETLESNRDMARADVPPPTRLRVYGFPRD